jgi:hypothetical protein
VQETGRTDATALMMPLRIKLSSPARAADLLAFLRGLGADAQMDAATALTVTRRHDVVPGEPAYQDRLELEFILQVWARGKNRDTCYEIEEAA